MTDPDAKPTSGPRRGQAFWLTAGEIIGGLALVIAGLNYWEGHHEHVQAARREQAQAQAATSFVATGEADNGGRTLGLRPLKATQAIQSQRFRFPADIRADPVEVTAERPRVEVDWVVQGLKRALETAHAKSTGEARVPVIIETVYVEDGETHQDVSLYQVGFAWKHEFLSGWQIRLKGMALSRRGLKSNAAAALFKPWSAAKAEFTRNSAIPPV